jgi:methionyl-tRNA formyltransferase
MSETRQRVVLVGLGSTTASALDALLERFEVVALVRPGDDRVVAAARAAGAEIHPDTGLASVVALVEDVRPDAVVVSSYDRILPSSLVSAVPCINVHYAPLPGYRGRATVNWAIINGETSTAMTVHCLEPDLDAGGILVQVPVQIGPGSTTGSLYDELNSLQRRHLADAVERRLGGDRGTPQDETQATYSCGRVPGDGEIDWHGSTSSVDRLVRALDGPFPPAFTHLGSARIEVLRAEPVVDAPVHVGRIPGRVIRVDRAVGHVDVLTGDGVLRLLAVTDGTSESTRPADLITSVRHTLVSGVEARLALVEQRLAAIQSEVRS